MPQYSSRQTSYLRISPHQVLQMVLYIDEENVAWMSDDVLERLLMALKDRIPVKLQSDLRGTKAEQAKNKIEVYRGADFQIAYFFRKMAQRHGVLLKDKKLLVTDPASPPPPSAKFSRNSVPGFFTRLAPDQERPSKKRRTDSVDLTGDHAPEDDAGAPPPAQQDDLIVVKDEEEELELGDLPLRDDLDPDEAKPDLKPNLKVSYTGYSIWGRSLIVIVEPYPPLSEAQKAQGRKTVEPTEVRQLSTSVAPQSYRSTASMTPLARRRRTPLFRTESTPLDEDEGEEEEEALRVQAREKMRERDGTVDTLLNEGEEDLPSVSQLQRRARETRSATRAAMPEEVGDDAI